MALAAVPQVQIGDMIDVGSKAMLQVARCATLQCFQRTL